VGIVYHQPGTLGPGFTGQSGEVGQIAVHAEYAIGDHQRTAAGFFQTLGKATCIVMQVAVEARPAQQTGIQQGGMVEAVFQHRIALPDQRGDGTHVGHVSVTEQQRTRATGELGQGLLQCVVRGAVTDDQMRRTAAYAPARCSRLPGFNHLRVTGQAQVVVIAEGEQRLAIDHHLRPLRAF